MTIVAMRHFPMTTVLPGYILRIHDVAIDTRGRIIACVRNCIRKVRRKSRKPYKNTDQNRNYWSPWLWGNKL